MSLLALINALLNFFPCIFLCTLSFLLKQTPYTKINPVPNEEGLTEQSQDCFTIRNRYTYNIL